MLDKYLNNRLITLYLIPLIIGSLTVFSFQPFNFTIVNFIVLPSFFYLIIYIKKKSKNIYRKKPYKRNLFIFGSLFGFGFFLSNLHWITHSLTFDDNFKYLIPFGLLFIPLFLSLFFSLTILIITPFLNLNFPSLLFFSASLAISDFIRAKILTGFPWNLWAYSFSWATEILQILNLSGFFCFNLIIITIFTLPAVVFFKTKIIYKFLVFTSLVLAILVLYISGSHSINKNQNILDSSDKKYYIKAISPNFKLEYGLDSNKIKNRLDKLIKYSEPDKDRKTLFVWPEGVFSGYTFEDVLDLRETFSKSFFDNHLILFGVNRVDKKTLGIYNSMVIVNNRMEIVREYNKQKLVPFGEFLPFEKILNKIGLKKITEGQGSFLAGGRQNNLVIDKLNILPLICYEIIFPEFLQSSDENTNIIINISEDGWFGNSIGPHQHFVKGVFRAVEQNSFLIRSANKGISAIINNKGEIVKKLTATEKGNIELEVPLLIKQNKNKNKNDLIFFVLLITYIFIFSFYKKKNND